MYIGLDSSVGRAPARQSGGRRFKSRSSKFFFVHPNSSKIFYAFVFIIFKKQAYWKINSAMKCLFFKSYGGQLTLQIMFKKITEHLIPQNIQHVRSAVNCTAITWLPFITIGDSQITPLSQARNLGVIFDSTMTLKPHISNIVRVSSFHIRNISRIRKYLNKSAAEQIIHAFVTSQLDNGNALLYGLPQNQISRLQHIQNTAARVVTLSRKSCHITPKHVRIKFCNKYIIIAVA